jgi:predicted glycosyltransferase
MKLLFYFGHPSQYYFLKNTFFRLRQKGHTVILGIKSKDVLETLLKEDNETYFNLLPEGRKQSKIFILIGLIKRDLRLLSFVMNKKIDLFVGTDPSLAHIGRLLNIPVLTVLEDDFEIIPALAKLTFPFTSYIITPSIVRVGKFGNKKIGYDGYMKLAYLHPNYFSPEDLSISKPYYLIRLSQLNAHHDFGISGITDSLMDRLISMLTARGKVLISSEKLLSSKYQSYQLNISPSKMHHYLANAEMLISDSQSMSMEAAMLGVPSIRFSDFAGRISVLEELEKKYELTFGIKTTLPEESIPNLYQEFQNRRQKMLADKIDVTAFMVWLIENYPESARVMKQNPDYQYNFK